MKLIAVALLAAAKRRLFNELSEDEHDNQRLQMTDQFSGSHETHFRRLQGRRQIDTDPVDSMNEGLWWCFTGISPDDQLIIRALVLSWILSSKNVDE